MVLTYLHVQIPEDEVLLFHEPMEMTIAHCISELGDNPMFCNYHNTYLDEEDNSLTVTMDMV